jgi:uncharacterized protein (TIGR03437 family)
MTVSRMLLAWISLLWGIASSQTVTSGSVLTSAQTVSFRFPAPTSVATTLYNGDRSFRITVPANTALLTISGIGTVPPLGSNTSEFGLVVRFNRDNEVSAAGVISADYRAEVSQRPSLQIGANSTPPLQPGTYYISIIANYGIASIANVPITGTLTATAHGPLADLAPTFLETPGQGLIGKRLATELRVTNRGPGVAPRSVTRYYFSRDRAITRQDTDTGWTCEHPEIAANAAHGCVGSIAVPAQLAPGEWYVGVLADADGALFETDENNNSLANGPVTLNYPLPSSLSVFPTALAFSAPSGGASPATQDLTVTAPSATGFRVTSNQRWLTASLSAGATPATLRISVNPQGLAIGMYWGEIAIAPDNDPLNAFYCAVGFVVYDPGATAALGIFTLPAQLEFSHLHSVIIPVEQRLYVRSGSSPIFGLGIANAGGNWLQASHFTDAIVFTGTGFGMEEGRYPGSAVLFCPRCTTPFTRISAELQVRANSITPPVAQVRLNGGGQSGPAGSILPVPVWAEVLNSGGKPVPDIEVVFTGENASARPATARTNGAGLAFTAMTPGPAAGRANLTATVRGIPPATVTATATAAATPVSEVSISDVVDGAAFQPAIASGGWVTIRGSRLAATTRTWEKRDFSGDRLPAALDGVSVTIAGRAAPVYFVSPSQVNVLAPLGLTAGTATVVVTTAQGSASKTVTVEAVRPAFFMLDPDGRKYLAAVHPDGRLAGKAGLFSASPNLTSPLAPGGRALLFGTGWGSTNPALPDGATFSDARPLTNPSAARISIGGQATTVEFAGAVSPGLYQFNIVVPNLPAGDHSVVGELNGIRTQGNAFLTLTAAPPPSISSLDPSAAGIGQTIERLIIAGQRLQAVTSVTFTPATGIAATILEKSDTAIAIRVVIAATAAAGERRVAVVSPGSNTSNSLPFQVNALPRLSIESVVPSSGRQGEVIETLTVTGQNLSGATRLVVTPATGITVSGVRAEAGGVTARLEIASTAIPGQRTLTVGDGVRTSNGVPFTIAAAPPLLISADPSSVEVSQIVITAALTGENLSGGRLVVEPAAGITVLGATAQSGSVRYSMLVANDAATGIRNLSVSTTGGVSNSVPLEVRPRSGSFTISNMRVADLLSGFRLTDFYVDVDFNDPSGSAASQLSFVLRIPSYVTVSGSTSSTGVAAGARSGTFRLRFTIPYENVFRLGTVQLNLVNGQGHRSNTLEGVF